MAEHCDKHLAAFLNPLVVASCQHPFPTMCQLAGGIGNVTNGARIGMWNTGTSPLSSVQFYVGDAQQGKSRLTAYISAIIAKTDQKIADMVGQVLDDAALPPGTSKPALTIRSTGMMDFTTTEFFVRGTGDWPMIKEFAELSDDVKEILKDIGARAWYNLTGNIDEAYPFAQGMGWLCCRSVDALLNIGLGL
jgi:hypothetical protein